MLVIDTNILLDIPQIIEEETEEMVIATDVLKELDGLKMHNNFDVQYKARRAAVIISHNMDKLTWDDSLEKERYDSVDDKVIQIAKNRNAILVTYDVYLKVKAIIMLFDIIQMLPSVTADFTFVLVVGQFKIWN